MSGTNVANAASFGASHRINFQIIHKHVVFIYTDTKSTHNRNRYSKRLRLYERVWCAVQTHHYVVLSLRWFKFFVVTIILSRKLFALRLGGFMDFSFCAVWWSSPCTISHTHTHTVPHWLVAFYFFLTLQRDPLRTSLTLNAPISLSNKRTNNLHRRWSTHDSVHSLDVLRLAGRRFESHKINAEKLNSMPYIVAANPQIVLCSSRQMK